MKDVSSVYQAHCQGRPLLRRGGQDSAKSVGLSDYQQQHRRVNKKVQQTQSQSTVTNILGSDEMFATTTRTTTSSLSCTNINCSKVSKRQCPFSLCRRCCLNHSSDNNTVTYNSLSKNEMNVDESKEISIESILPIPSELIVICKVHRQKQKSFIQSRTGTSTNINNKKEHTDSLKGNIEQNEEEGLEENVVLDEESPPPKSSYPLDHDNINGNNDGIDNFELSMSISMLHPDKREEEEECHLPTTHLESRQLLSLEKRNHNSMPYPTTTAAVTDGSVTTDDDQFSYCSSAKVFLVGLGADEQLGGYSRHRSCYQRGGEVALRNELAEDCERLWKRNLGRDDRCISDNGREAWFPYLDEDVVAFIQSLPLQAIVDLSLPLGEGDKLILRQAARKLGLGDSTTLVKRAIQFGSRIAQITNSRNFGSNRKGQGKTKISELSSTGVVENRSNGIEKVLSDS